MEAIDEDTLENWLVTLLCQVYPTCCTTLELARHLGTSANRQYIKKAANRVLYNSALHKGYIVNTGGTPPRWSATPQAMAEFTQQPNGQPEAVEPPPPCVHSSTLPSHPPSIEAQPMLIPPGAVPRTVVQGGAPKQAPVPATIHHQSEGFAVFQTGKQPRVAAQASMASLQQMQQNSPQVGMYPAEHSLQQGAQQMASNTAYVPQVSQPASIHVQHVGGVGLHTVPGYGVHSQNLTRSQSQLAPKVPSGSEMYSGHAYAVQQTPQTGGLLGASQGLMLRGPTGKVGHLTTGSRFQAPMVHVDPSEVCAGGKMGGGYPPQKGLQSMGCRQPRVVEVEGIPLKESHPPMMLAPKRVEMDKNGRPDLWSKPRGKKQVRVEQSKPVESVPASGQVEGTVSTRSDKIKIPRSGGSVESSCADIEPYRSTGVLSGERNSHEPVWFSGRGLNMVAAGRSEAVQKAGLGGYSDVAGVDRAAVEAPTQWGQVQSQQSCDGNHLGYQCGNHCDDKRTQTFRRGESVQQRGVGGMGPPGIVVGAGVAKSVVDRSEDIDEIRRKLHGIKSTWEREAGDGRQ